MQLKRLGASCAPGLWQDGCLRHSTAAVYCQIKCSGNVNGFVRKMHDMRNMQSSVCLCGKRAYV